MLHVRRQDSLQVILPGALHPAEAALSQPVHMGISTAGEAHQLIIHERSAGLEHLAGLARLETLILRGDEITDRGLVHLEGLSSLKKLDIEFAAVTDEGVAQLQKALPNCDINY